MSCPRILAAALLLIGCGASSPCPTTPDSSESAEAPPERTAPEYSITNVYDAFGRDHDRLDRRNDADTTALDVVTKKIHEALRA